MNVTVKLVVCKGDKMSIEIVKDMGNSLVEHSVMISNLSVAISSCLKGSLCRLYTDNIKYTWADVSDESFEPDISIVCGRLRKCRNTAVSNIPQFVIEVLSPSTEKRDREDKMFSYSKAGVSEYWLIDWKKKKVELYLNDEETGEPQFYKIDEVTESNKQDLWVRTMPRIKLNFDEVFDLYIE